MAAHQNSQTRQGWHFSEATKRSKITLKELQSFTAEIGVPVHRTTLSRTLYSAGVFAKRYLGVSPKIWKKDSGQIRQKLSFLAIKEYAMSGRNPTPLLTPRKPSHDGSIMLWGCFSSAGIEKLVRVEGMMDGAKYREILEGNLSQSSRDLRLGQRFTFQQDN
jgi:hypothetical protein